MLAIETPRPSNQPSEQMTTANTSAEPQNWREVSNHEEKCGMCWHKVSLIPSWRARDERSRLRDCVFQRVLDGFSVIEGAGRFAAFDEIPMWWCLFGRKSAIPYLVSHMHGPHTDISAEPRERRLQSGDRPAAELCLLLSARAQGNRVGAAPPYTAPKVILVFAFSPDHSSNILSPFPLCELLQQDRS